MRSVCGGEVTAFYSLANLMSFLNPYQAPTPANMECWCNTSPSENGTALLGTDILQEGSYTILLSSHFEIYRLIDI